MTREDQSKWRLNVTDLAAQLKDTPRALELLNAANQRILVLDGAMGTLIQGYNLTEVDFGGPQFEGCNENLVLTRPDLILEIHERYLAAGADIVETNSFGSTPLVLAEYGLESQAYQISKKSAELARKACEKFSTPKKMRFVAGSMGPTTKAISVTGGVSFSELVATFQVQAEGLLDGGADYLLIETAQDSRNTKAALIAIQALEHRKGHKIQVAVSGTIETMGTMLAGQTVEAFLASVMHRDLFYIGLNCATGPEFMTDHIRTLANLSPFRVACVPNAGLPDEDGQYLETPEMMGRIIKDFANHHWLNLVGGCCGTTEKHTHHFAEIVQGTVPRSLRPLNQSLLSGVDFLEVTDEMRPLIVGERTNVIGSKKFRDLIAEQKFEEAADIARAQVKSGAHIVDICLSNPDRNEFDDTDLFLQKVIRIVKAPLMIDSTDERVIELALTYCQGKSIINSINLEDGEERFEKVIPLAKQYGAALVVGTIDEDPLQGMAVTRERKLAIAKRSFELLTQKYKILAEDIYFDALVFPCATGDQNYIGSARETIEGIRLIKQAFPKCKTILGISNVSFGLPPAGREVLNSVFLHHCVQAGLDLAIVNAEKLERYASLSPQDIALADNLIDNRGEDPIGKFAAAFREVKVKVKLHRQDIPIEKRLANNIIEGSKDGLLEDLEILLKTKSALDIVNGPLMSGMDEVGRLFNDNKLIVAEVLQSAEVMKTAVAYVEPYMEKTESTSRGKMLLATVKGDVHDIGKNLVDIILSNNGYQVINLGIKVPPEKIVEACREHNPDFIGLSGLLVKSAQQMIATAEDLSKAGISVPMLVGGAALSKNFTHKRILPAYAGPVLYASDAMHGLDLANQIRDPLKLEKIQFDCDNQRKNLEADFLPDTTAHTPLTTRSGTVEIQAAPPQPKDFHRHVVKQFPLEVIWKFINPLMLYSRHLGLKGGTVKQLLKATTDRKIRIQLEREEPKAIEIFDAVESLKEECKSQDLFRPSAIYQYFPAYSTENSLNLLDENSQNIVHQFHFLRQNSGKNLCLSDYVNPQSAFDRQTPDNLALFIVTAGHGIRKHAEELKNSGQYLKSHILQALAIETAEALAEYLHSQLRGQWGFSDLSTTTMMDRFQAKYRGKRYSFGYPACPRLDDQTGLFQLLRPHEIGVELTDGFMMDPEASVSAIVFHHPQSEYFSVGLSHQEETI